jgi:hypothetical protein
MKVVHGEFFMGVVHRKYLRASGARKPGGSENALKIEDRKWLFVIDNQQPFFNTQFSIDRHVCGSIR